MSSRTCWLFGILVAALCFPAKAGAQNVFKPSEGVTPWPFLNNTSTSSSSSSTTRTSSTTSSSTGSSSGTTATTTPTSSSSTGSSSSSSSFSSTGSTGGGVSVGSTTVQQSEGVQPLIELNVNAGAAEINRDFGKGLVGRSQAAEHFVGAKAPSQFVGATSRTSGNSRKSSSLQNSFRRFTQASRSRSTRRPTNQNGFRSKRSGRYSTTRAFGFNSANLGTFRPQLRLGFTVRRPVEVTQTAAVLRTRLKAMSAVGVQLKGIDIQVTPEGVVVLSGQVESESAKRLAENLVRLEPGVRHVENHLQVRSLAELEGNTHSSSRKSVR